MTSYVHKSATLYQTPVKAGVFARITSALAVWKQRRTLARLDPHLLQDIGVSQDEAQLEANRAPWDVPAHWRQ